MKPAVLVWIMLATALAGTGVITVLLMPELQDQLARAIPIAALAGALLAIPISIGIAAKIRGGVRLG